MRDVAEAGKWAEAAPSNSSKYLHDSYFTSSEIARWNQFVHGNGGHVFQTYDWGQLSRRLGWQPQYLIWEDGSGRRLAQATVLVRSRLMGKLKMHYAPRGPVVSGNDAATWAVVASGLGEFARTQGSIVLRVNPPTPALQGVGTILGECGWERATTREMHVRTFRLTLPLDEKALWDGLEYRTQKAIKKADRAGVRVTKEIRPDAIDEFISLYGGTARRKNIACHQPDFVRAVWQEFAAKGWAHLFLARVKGVAIAGLFLFQYGDTMEEMWIGWDACAGEVRPNQYLHWEILCWCLQNNIRTYDFGGVPLEAAPDHGVYFYKSGFGAQLVDLAGEYDTFPSKWARVVWGMVRPMMQKIRALLTLLVLQIYTGHPSRENKT